MTSWDEVTSLARTEIEAKGREDAVGDLSAVAEKIALGALHYYLLQTAPSKDMLYDPVASLSFNGDTGPYIQYMGARASSILRKHEAGEGNAVKGHADPAKLSDDADWAVIRLVGAPPRGPRCRRRLYGSPPLSPHTSMTSHRASRHGIERTPSSIAPMLTWRRAVSNSFGPFKRASE